MTVECKFVGGPLDGKIGNVSGLHQCQIFFDTRQRQVFCYNRIDELVYVFEREISAGLTKNYDVSFEKFSGSAPGKNTVESFKVDK
jgi:hypothetical protein